MSAICIVPITADEVSRIRTLDEGHFLDIKGISILPGKLSRSLAAFANAEGGEIFIGINEASGGRSHQWWGFGSVEDANGFIQAFEVAFPLGEDCHYTFLSAEGQEGYVLKVEIKKSRDVRFATDGRAYVRRGAQNLPIEGEEALVRLRRNKGLTSFETEPVNTDDHLITNSAPIIEFMLAVIPTAEPEDWLRKQQLIIDGKPTVAGLLLFAEEPQAVLPKRCGLKIYRYKTRNDEGTRETLDFHPISVEGNLYDQIKQSVGETAAIVESVRITTQAGLEEVKYPIDALHEIITNAVLHRDYSIADDVHIRIFDNRVEVLSPGTLPAHVTPENILHERFARNGVIVRLINKFPDPPNKDVGEGLNTAFEAMRAMRLKPPIISQEGGYVKVSLRHESLATPEEIVLEYLQIHDQITNRQAREICFIGSENKMKTIFQRMIRQGLIELVPGATRYTAAYRLVTRHEQQNNA